MQVRIEPNYIYVKVPYHLKERAKALGAEWNESRRMWRFLNNLYVMRELLKTFPELQQNQAFMEYGKKKRETQDRLLQIKALPDTDGDPRLRPYQRVDVKYLAQLPAAGIFNEQRTGKTPTTLLLLKEIGARTALIVAPASLLLNWKKEAETWLPHAHVYVARGKPAERKKLYEKWITHTESAQSMNLPCALCVISYETLRKDLQTLKQSVKRFDVIVADEVHRLRHRDTQQSKAVMEMRKLADRAYALTGTPTVKEMTDIFGILQFLYPERFTSYWGFVKRYFIVSQDYFGATTITENPFRTRELQEIVGLISVQRKRAEVMKWLPPKQRQTLLVEMDDKQRKAYEQMEKTFIVQLEGGYVDAASVLAQMLRLRQICLAPELLGIDAPSAKEKALIEWLEDNREPVVVMSWFTSYLKILAKKLEEKGYRVSMIHGEMSAEQKFQAAKEFQEGRLDVLLCNIISAGVGLTLDRAETVIFLDKAFNPSENEQAEDRIVPVSEERNHSVNIISIVCKNTIDEEIEKLLEKKTDVTGIINNGSREAIIKMLRKRY